MSKESYRYTKDHEWININPTGATIGITDHAQQELGDIVFVDLPAVGTKIKKGESFCTVESVKAVSDVYAPVDGEITAINQKLENSPELVNSAPYEDGWFVTVTLTNFAQAEELMDYSTYEKYVSQGG